ncbi:MAG: M20/M25/M40 family metallo-hydrolase [Nitrososphaerota archaeon]|nr:M20/M25/M40 family metallo-hydrolase [Nitrososphaerota archaeon]MDG6979046.1 M20/M25/M40 family metallo-hydrolase [Nitrososphaerota archaeon]MDG7005681.1 M20/M25/M40 family metallo-hydrolase [Nitrososphaerota archaeon]MDG7021252.1 M20/M25/M40 family metallo-hydrolase [Nitrososphaerota archaeon]MDG7022369.1 M20/M25/M40 family metallo-hydrolase [Nitrososphaerota archaeon]
MRPAVDPAVRLLLDALGTYSVSTKEERLSKLLRARMKERGFKGVRTDKAGNAIGEVGSGRPHVLLCGHMDTVPGFIKPRVVGDRVYGRGASDAKSPMCAMLSAVSRGAVPEGMKVTMACVTREEGDSLGVETLIAAGGDYDYAVFGEPAGAARITVGYRGRTAARVSVKTHGGHASSSWAHPSAVDESLAIMSLIKEYEAKNTVVGDHFRSLSASLTVIRGGGYSNVVPKKCDMTFDVRIPPGRTSAGVKDDLAAIVGGYARMKGGLEAAVEFEGSTEAYDAPLDSVVVRGFQRSILKTLNTRPVLTHKTGTGDMNTLAERMKIPCLTYGPADSNLGHTEMEFVEIPDYLGSIRVISGALLEIKGLHSRAG